MTFLQMVRTDVKQISSILDSTFYELNQQEVEAADQILLHHYKKYFDQCKQFLFGQINYDQAVHQLQASSQGKGVCAKTLGYGDVAWKCETCEKDPTCIICQECFEKGNHKGHRIRLKKNVSGCCDCGDPDAWDEEGFCSDHKGYAASSEVLLENLPQHIKQAAPIVFDAVAKQLKLESLQLQLDKVLGAKGGQSSEEFQKRYMKRAYLILQLYQFMCWAIEASPAFIHYLTDSLNKVFLEESKKVEGHECCPRSFLNEQDKESYLNLYQKFIQNQELDQLMEDQFEQTESIINSTTLTEEQLKNLEKTHNICICNVADLTFQTNHLLAEDIRKTVEELYFKMFQSFKFKQVLGLAFAANFEVLSFERANNHNIGQIGVQLLTIDEIALMILKNEDLKNNIIQGYSKITDKLIERDFNEADLNALFHVLCDLKYLARPKVLAYVIEQTDFLECLLEQLPKYYYTDKIQLRSEHVIFDQSVFKQGLYTIDLQLTKIYKQYLKEVNPFNIERNQKIMQAFITFFTDLNTNMPSAGTDGFFAIPLHRIFSYYLSRLIMQNYFVDKKKYPQKRPKELIKEIFKRFVIVPLDQNIWNYIQNLIQVIVRPLAKSWAVTHEIMCGKWVMSGFYIMQLPKLLYSVFEYYLLLNLNLFQMLICISPEPHKTIDEILAVYQQDQWMKQFHSDLIKRSVTASSFNEFKPLFDEKKLRQMIHWQFRLFNQLSVIEVSFIYPLLSNLNPKYQVSFTNQELNDNIVKLFKSDMKRDIIHNLINSGCKSDIKQLKKQSDPIYVESEQYEEVLLEVSEQLKDSVGKISFKLKDQYLQWFEPYFFTKPENQIKVQEVTQNFYSEKKLLNEILGDYKELYSFQSPINYVIKEAIAQSTLLSYIKEAIILWQRPSDIKIIDDQIGHQCLKLLMIILQSSQNLPQHLKMQIAQMIKDNNDELIDVLSSLGKNGGLMEGVVKELLTHIYELDHQEFHHIADKLGIKEVEEQKADAQTSDSQQSSKEEDKEAARKRREEILKKFQDKRKNYISKNVSEEVSRSSSFKDSSNQVEEEEIECSLCKETLLAENFYSQPYGQFAYITKSKLMYHSIRQTLWQSKENLDKVKLSMSNQNAQQFEELKQSEELKSSIVGDENLLDRMQINYLNSKSGTGGVLNKCSHYSHYKCLANYLTSNEALAKRDIKKIIGLDIETFQCPLCKHISNVLFPCDNLSSFIEKQQSHKDLDQIMALRQFYSALFSKIIKAQLIQKEDTLPVDIKNQPAKFAQAVQQFVEHRVQIIDLKGIHEFLQKHKHKVSKIEYADLIEQARNVLKLALESNIKENTEDQVMTEETLNGVCLQAISDILLQLFNSVSLLFENDLSSIALQLMFYSALIFGDDPEKQSKSLFDIIKLIYQPFKLQVLLKSIFMKHNGMIRGTQENIMINFNQENLIKVTLDESLQEGIIQSQLSFLRKMTAFVILVHSIHRRKNEKLYKEEEKFATNLTHQYDDASEFKLLCGFLKLDPSFDFLQNDNKGQQQEISSLVDNFKADQVHNDYPEEFQALFNEISTAKLLESLETYLQLELTRGAGIQESSISPELMKEVIEMKGRMTTFKMPEYLHLLTSQFTFKLQELPSDFNSLVQTYYKHKCKNCGKQPKESCICLLCGEIVCFLQKCCSDLPGMRKLEGELTFHARVCEGGETLYLCTSNGKIILVEGDRSCQKHSPYINKFGETFSQNSKRWDNFFMDSETGGIHIYEEFRKMYMNFNVANEIIKERSMAEVVWRLRAI